MNGPETRDAIMLGFEEILHQEFPHLETQREYEVGVKNSALTIKVDTLRPQQPCMFIALKLTNGQRVIKIAFHPDAIFIGRDGRFPGSVSVWPTTRLTYEHPDLQEQIIEAVKCHTA